MILRDDVHIRLDVLRYMYGIIKCTKGWCTHICIHVHVLRYDTKG